LRNDQKNSFLLILPKEVEFYLLFYQDGEYHAIIRFLQDLSSSI